MARLPKDWVEFRCGLHVATRPLEARRSNGRVVRILPGDVVDLDYPQAIYGPPSSPKTELYDHRRSFMRFRGTHRGKKVQVVEALNAGYGTPFELSTGHYFMRLDAFKPLRFPEDLAPDVALPTGWEAARATQEKFLLFTPNGFTISLCKGRRFLATFEIKASDAYNILLSIDAPAIDPETYWARTDRVTLDDLLSAAVDIYVTLDPVDRYPAHGKASCVVAPSEVPPEWLRQMRRIERKDQRRRAGAPA